MTLRCAGPVILGQILLQNKIFSRVTTDLEYDGYSLFPKKDGSSSQYNSQSATRSIWLDGSKISFECFYLRIIVLHVIRCSLLTALLPISERIDFARFNVNSIIFIQYHHQLMALLLYVL